MSKTSTDALRFSWRARLALIGGSTLVTLIVVELVMRTLFPASTHHLMYTQSDDELLSIDLRKGAEIEFEGVTQKIAPTQVQISSQGLRDREFVIPKPAGTKRLLCVGDSITFGWGVEENEGYCHRLEALLGGSWQTVNLGLPGYNTAQEIRRLERFGLQFEADVVLVQFDDNDFEGPANHGDTSSMSSWLIDHFAIARWLRARGIWAYEEPQDVGPGGPGDEREAVDEPNDREARNEANEPESQGGQPPVYDGRASIQQAFDQLNTLVQKHGFKAIVFFPNSDETELMEQLRGLKISNASYRPALMGPPEKLEIPNDGHPSAEGHRRIAKLMADVLKAKGLAP